MRSNRLAQLAALLMLPAIAAQKPPADNKELAAELHTYLRRCADFGWAGAALVAVDGAVVLQRGYGLADRGRTTPNIEHTLFEIASTTKQFTAAAILKLEAAGVLSTDDLISKHLPGVPAAFDDITIYHLLTHTAGMPRSGPSGSGDDLEAAVKAYFGARRDRDAGERFEYWNGGYALLAGIIERVSGKTYMDYCRTELFEPAGMTRSGFTGDELVSPAAIGYDGDAPVRPATGHPYGSYGWQYRGMGGAVTSVVELYKWDRALRGDDVLPQRVREKMFKPFRANYACGWYVLQTPRGTRKITHGGAVRGFHTHFSRFPEDDVVVIVTSNVQGVPVWSIGATLEAMVFREQPKFPGPPATVRLGEQDLRALEGAYRLPDESRLVVRREGNGLRLGAEGQSAVDLLLMSRVENPGRFGNEEEWAERVVKGVAGGDPEFLREIMLKWIPKTWPDRVVESIWPAQVEKWGELESVRVLGSSAVGRKRVRVILALEHERGSGRTRIEFQDGKLNIHDFNGPEFPATADFMPTSPTSFARFAFVGPPKPGIEFARGRGGVAKLVVHQQKEGSVPCSKVEK